MIENADFGTVMEMVKLGKEFRMLSAEHWAWSQVTFGTAAERGPIGALKHLEKEAREAQAVPTDKVEYADCLLLLLDASRRAGIGPLELVRLARDKHQINRTKRTWPKPAKGDEPTEHVRGSEPEGSGE